jgi:hypothetical protein
MKTVRIPPTTVPRSSYPLSSSSPPPAPLRPLAHLASLRSLRPLSAARFASLPLAPQMFKPVRIGATLILLGAIAMTFMGAFLLHNAVLCLVMVIVEYLAYLWYSLSYIPYARNVSPASRCARLSSSWLMCFRCVVVLGG